MDCCDTDWVTFVDGDDWVDSDMCERFTQYLEKTKDEPDIYIFSGYRSYPDHEEGNCNEEGIKHYRTREEINQLQIDALTTFVIGKPDNIVPFDSAWGKFFNRSFLFKNDMYLYENIQTAGFILVFREHSQSMIGKKKGNVDTDIVFAIMSKIADGEKFDNVILVSGDGDYCKMVKYLIEKKRFAKLLAPNRHSTSSLYRPFTPKYVDFLDNPGVKNKIEHKKRS